MTFKTITLTLSEEEFDVLKLIKDESGLSWEKFVLTKCAKGKRIIGSK